jgi:hypothetical protein
VAAQTAPRPVVVAIVYLICLGLIALLASALGHAALAAVAGAGALIA